MLSSHSGLLKIAIFRKNMKLGMESSKIKEFWPDSLPLNQELIWEEKDNSLRERKLEIVRKNLKYLLLFDWVKFIGVTGSIAAGTLKEEDDIDLFIVVKNDRMWIYRGIIILRLMFLSIRRMWGDKDVMDKLDTNFICEERGLAFRIGNIFVAHELLYMIPVYNKDYYEFILDCNSMLLLKYDIIRNAKSVVSKRSGFRYLNKILFFMQLGYMYLLKHNPEIERLKRNNRLGRIAFYPKGYNLGKVREYKDLKKKYSKE